MRNLRWLSLLTASGVSMAMPNGAWAGTLTTLYTFTALADGSEPNGLVFNAGTLYGTTRYGGAGGGTLGYGTVFKLDVSTGVHTILHSFSNTDGAYPETNLLLFSGALYGGTTAGGVGNQGTLFKVEPNSGNTTILHTFSGGTDGGEVFGGLTAVGNALYGTTIAGGTAGAGVLFKLDPTTGAVTTLHSFGGVDGSGATGLAEYAGALYGTTSQGGAANYGFLFKLDPTNGAETVLHEFTSGEGRPSNGSLIVDAGKLYGTAGSSNLGGRIFKSDPNTGTTTIVYKLFASLKIYAPNSPLTLVQGQLYDMTTYGGTQSSGTIFAVDPRRRVGKILYSFTGNYGNPSTGLTYDGGNFYGTTTGTVFKFSP